MCLWYVFGNIKKLLIKYKLIQIKVTILVFDSTNRFDFQQLFRVIFCLMLFFRQKSEEMSSDEVIGIIEQCPSAK